jgi:hypothetical protein
MSGRPHDGVDAGATEVDGRRHRADGDGGDRLGGEHFRSQTEALDGAVDATELSPHLPIGTGDGIEQVGAELDALLAGGATAPTQLPPTAASPPPRKLPYALRGVDLSKSRSPVARAFSGTDGVVVLRFAYVNVR